MGGEHGEDAPVLKRIAAAAQPLAQVLVEPADQPVHQIRQQIVEARGAGHQRLRAAGSQVAIARKQEDQDEDHEAHRDVGHGDAM